MTDFAGKNWKGTTGGDTAPHPPREQLLLWLDGELNEAENNATKAHLEACWKCRAHVAEIEATITTFSQFDDEVLMNCLPSPPNRWQGFARRLQQLSSSNGAPSWRLRWRNWWARTIGSLQQPRWATAMMLAVGIAALSFWLLRSTPVSARELIRRSIQAETASLQKNTEPVLYHKLQVRRQTAHVTDAVTWESWRAAQGDQFRQRVADQQGTRFLRTNDMTAPPLLTAIEQILTLNQLDVQRPLSAAAFERWRTNFGSSVVETVSNNGDKLMLTVQTPAPHALHAIRQASLLVRREDWHVVALQLQVQGEADVQFYELNEAVYEVLSLDALTVFANLAMPTPASVPARSPLTPTGFPSPGLVVPLPLPSASVSPVAPLPSASALQEAEVAALYALHQARADLGEQIEVIRENGRQIVVQGLVQTAARKAELLQTLSAIALVHPRILTIEEAVQQAQRATPPATNNNEVTTSVEVTIASSEAAPKVNPFQQKLAEYFGGRKGLSEAEREAVNQRVTQFYNTIEADASAATSAAWALRRWQERLISIASAGVELTPAARQQLDEMFKNHLARLRQRTNSLQARLHPPLLALAGDPGNPSPSLESTRSAGIQTVFQSVERVNGLCDQLIAGKEEASLQATARALLMELARLDAVLKTLEAH